MSVEHDDRRGRGGHDDRRAENWRHHAAYLGYTAVWEATARLPEAVAWRVPDRLGDAWYRFGGRARRRQVRLNLSRACGHPPADVLEEVTRRAYRSYARYWVDAFRAHTLNADDVRARSGERGLGSLDELAASGRGGILATGHIGSWDLGAFYATQRGWRLVVIAERLRPRRLFERFVRLRETLGIDVIPLERGADTIGQLETEVRDGAIATLLADRDLTGRGPVVEFFGEPCRLPPGPAALARRTGRPVVPGAFFTTPGGWVGIAHEPIDVANVDVETGTQRIASALEGLIGEAPHQWHVFVPNWLAEREPDHPAVRPG